MWEIRETFDDHTHPTGRGRVYLNPDKGFNPYTIDYPVVWSGTISGRKVEIVQQGPETRNLEHFDFQVYPEGYYYLRGEIITWINDYNRNMLDK